MFLGIYMVFQLGGMMVFSLYLINKNLLENMYRRVDTEDTVERYSLELASISLIVVSVMGLVQTQLHFLPYNTISGVGTLLAIAITMFFSTELSKKKVTTRFSKHRNKAYKLSSIVCLAGYIVTIIFLLK
ncbi:hypothetical protein [Bacillus thuringiensis]|uniref:hypothetical protein n=1 Tax=Bacillus thuringiensis TaxID=1428 RepID=UPI0020CE789A|nr:hypothetical protein [Bacillus thuringiensis]